MREDRRHVFYSVHNDDEALYGAFTILREQPKVVNPLWCDVQERRGSWITAAERALETVRALEILRPSGMMATPQGTPYHEQWGIPESDPDWALMLEKMQEAEADVVWAPAVEPGGHEQHNRVGELARFVYGDKVQPYLTHNHGGRKSVSSVVVPILGDWAGLKLRALSCYRSQMIYPATRRHFLDGLLEYYGN